MYVRMLTNAWLFILIAIVFAGMAGGCSQSVVVPNAAICTNLRTQFPDRSRTADTDATKREAYVRNKTYFALCPDKR